MQDNKINVDTSFYVVSMHPQQTIQRGIKKTILFMIASKKDKILHNKFSHSCKDLYTDKYKTLLEEIEEDTN